MKLKRLSLLLALVMGLFVSTEIHAQNILQQLGNAFNSALNNYAESKMIEAYGKNSVDYNNFIALYNKGCDEYKSGDFECALYYFKEARNINTKSTNQYFKEYYKLYLKKSVDEAISTSETYYKLSNPQRSSSSSSNSNTSTQSTNNSQYNNTYVAPPQTPHPQTCTSCSGTGKCWTCNGSGYVKMGRSGHVCGSCSGRGICAVCSGTGISGYVYY